MVAKVLMGCVPFLIFGFSKNAEYGWQNSFEKITS